MPLYWTIDSKERLFIGSGEGEVTFAHAMALLDALGVQSRILMVHHRS
jgi:hypothetical protein